MPLRTRLPTKCSDEGTNRHDPCRLPNCAMHLGGCPIAVPDGWENIRVERSHITHSVKLSWSALSRQTSGSGNKVGKSEGVHIVHTLNFGSGRTGAGLGRIGDVCGGVE